MTKIRVPNIEHLLRPKATGAENVPKETIAFHEAGHVLVSHYYHRKVYSAELKVANDRSSNNFVEFEPTPYIERLIQRQGNPVHLWPRALEQTLVTVRILFGGPHAQALHQQVPIEKVEGGDDYRMAINSLLALERLRSDHPDLKNVRQNHREENILDTLANDAKKVIYQKQNFPLLENIANDLLEKTKLDTDEINLLLKSMQRQDNVQNILRRLVSHARPNKPK